MSIEFQNRTIELNVVEGFSQSEEVRRRCVVLHTSPASGLTSFLQHAASTLANEDCLTVYTSSLKSGPSQLFEAFFLALETQMDGLARRVERPEALRKFVRDTIGGGLSFLVPGGGFLKPTTNKLFDRIRSSYHSSAIAERFAHIASGALCEKSILFLIDNAQNMRADDLDVFRETIGREFANVRFVLGYVERPDASVTLEELSDRLESIGQDIGIQRFDPPDALLAEDLLSAAAVPWTPEFAADLAREHQGNAHKIIAAIRRLGDKPGPEALSTIDSVSRSILRYLVVAEQALPISFLIDVIKDDPTIMLDPTKSAEDVLAPLIDLRILTLDSARKGFSAVNLNADSHPIVLEILADKVHQLVTKNTLYRALARQSGHADQTDERLLTLRYNLAREIDPARADRFATALVERAIRSGSLETAMRFSEGLPSPDQACDLSSFLISVAFLIATKRYEDARDALDQPPQLSWSTDRTTEVYKAICLDRTRENRDAVELIETLYETNLPSNVAATLGAVKCASLAHLGCREDAHTILNDLRLKSDGARNIGYLLRNAAALFPPKQAISLLEEAKRAFSAEGDRYAVFTSQVNIGSMQANAGDYKSARRNFGDASRGLSGFGFAHMEEVICNLAFLEIDAGEYHAAAYRLQDMIDYAKDEMPKLYAYDHFALLMAVDGRKVDAYNALEAGDRLSRSIHVPIARLRHTLNAVLIRRALGDAVSFEHIKARARQGLTGTNLEVCREILSRLDGVWDTIDPECLVKTYSPGFLEYWSFDAFSVLPATLLPRIAVREDV